MMWLVLGVRFVGLAGWWVLDISGFGFIVVEFLGGSRWVCVACCFGLMFCW